MVMKNYRSRQTILNMAWIDYKEAYDMVPHSWILESISLVGIANNINRLLENNMANWKTELTAGKVHIKRGIFQGDSLSPLLFVITMIPISHLLRERNKGYQFGEKGRKINHQGLK